MAQENHVEDDEELYRSIREGQYTIENGILRPNSQAFSDRYKKPSVDRANLVGNDPEQSKKSETDGVVSIVVTQVRETTIEDYQLNVISRPIINHETLPDNPAHAQIEPNKEYTSDKHFRKVIQRLSRLAEERGWLIEPSSK